MFKRPITPLPDNFMKGFDATLKRQLYKSTDEAAKPAPVETKAEPLVEGVENLSSARLKYHAVNGFPHGRYTTKEINDEAKRRAKSEPNYHTVKASLNEQRDDEDMQVAMVNQSMKHLVDQSTDAEAAQDYTHDLISQQRARKTVRDQELFNAVAALRNAQSKKLDMMDEEIKGWKNAGRDMAKHRSNIANASKTVKLVRLKKDGAENKMHDAVSMHKDEVEAIKTHAYRVSLNPGKIIGHNLYIDGKFSKALKEETDLMEASIAKGQDVEHHSSISDHGKKFVRAYTAAMKGDHRSTGPTPADEKASEKFWTDHKSETIKSGFAGSGVHLYTHKPTGNKYKVAKSANGKGFHGTTHFISDHKDDVKEETISENTMPWSEADKLADKHVALAVKHKKAGNMKAHFAHSDAANYITDRLVNTMHPLPVKSTMLMKKSAAALAAHPLKEETDLQELSNDVLKSYLTKATAQGKEQWGTDKWTRKSLNRTKHTMRADQIVRDRENPINPKVVKLTGLSDGDVYDRTQWDEKINDGDVLKLKGNRYAVLIGAWPTIIVGDSKVLHTFKAGTDLSNIDRGKYAKSVALINSLKEETDLHEEVELDEGMAHYLITNGTGAHHIHSREHTKYSHPQALKRELDAKTKDLGWEKHHVVTQWAGNIDHEIASADKTAASYASSKNEYPVQYYGSKKTSNELQAAKKIIANMKEETLAEVSMHNGRMKTPAHYAGKIGAKLVGEKYMKKDVEVGHVHDNKTYLNPHVLKKHGIVPMQNFDYKAVKEETLDESKKLSAYERTIMRAEVQSINTYLDDDKNHRNAGKFGVAGRAEKEREKARLLKALGEETLDELSNDTLKSYATAAKKDVMYTRVLKGMFKPGSKSHDDAVARHDARKKGLESANKKLNEALPPHLAKHLDENANLSQAQAWSNNLKTKSKEDVFSSWKSTLGKVHNADIRDQRKSWMIHDILKQKFGSAIADQVK